MYQASRGVVGLDGWSSWADPPGFLKQRECQFSSEFKMDTRKDSGFNIVDHGLVGPGYTAGLDRAS